MKRQKAQAESPGDWVEALLVWVWEGGFLPLLQLQPLLQWLFQGTDLLRHLIPQLLTVSPTGTSREVQGPQGAQVHSFRAGMKSVLLILEVRG